MCRERRANSASRNWPRTTTGTVTETWIRRETSLLSKAQGASEGTSRSRTRRVDTDGVAGKMTARQGERHVLTLHFFFDSRDTERERRGPRASLEELRHIV